MVALQTQGVHWRGREVYSSDMVELKTFGERVAWLLKRRRLADQPIASQKELAVRIGMKPQQLNAYMQGRRNLQRALQSMTPPLPATRPAYAALTPPMFRAQWTTTVTGNKSPAYKPR